MTQQSQMSDIANLMADNGNSPEPENESTGAADEVHEILESQTEEAEELEADSDGNEEPAIEGDDSDETEWQDVNSDGEDLQVTPKEKEQGYLRDSDYRKKTMKLAESRKEVEAKAASIDAKLAELDSFIKREETDTDWEDLKRNNPSEFIERRDAIDKAKATADKAQAERNTELAKQNQDLVNTEKAKLVEVMGGDTWTQEQRNVDMKAASEYLASKGVTDEQVNGITSHVMWGIIFDASKAQSFNESKSKVREQVRSAPKSVKPGQKQPAGQRKRAAINKQLKSAKKGTQIDALANLFDS